MNKCIIVGASPIINEFKYDDNDFIIGVDGGISFLLKHHYKISLGVGDFDSLGYVPNDIKIIKLDPIKDITDTNRALLEAYNLGYKEIEIYGCLGGRIDHSIAIIQDGYKYHSMGLKITIFGDKQRITYLTNSSLKLNKKDGYISIFALDSAKGVSIKNLKYEVNDITLNNTYPLGVSNEFINKNAYIEVKQGTLLIVY